MLFPSKTISSDRPINWKTESGVLRDDMPREFRDILLKLHKGPNVNPETMSARYISALQAMGAMTYAVAIGTAAAHLKSSPEARDELSKTLHEINHMNLLRDCNSNQDYVRLCIEYLPKILQTIGATKEDVGFLNDIILRLSPRDDPATQVDIDSRLEAMRKFQARNGFDAHALNHLYDLIASLFGFWPQYALGFLDDSKDAPHIRFDTDELGDIRLSDAQAQRLRFDRSKIPEDLRNIIDDKVTDGATNSVFQAIDEKRLRTVFLAELDSQRLWMITPFVFNYTPESGAESSEVMRKFPSAGTQYLFLAPTWPDDSAALCWRRFHSALD